jgi:hypothetical protein
VVAYECAARSLSVGQKRQHLFVVVASVMPDNPEHEGEAMAAKFEIRKDHAGKFRLNGE